MLSPRVFEISHFFTSRLSEKGESPVPIADEAGRWGSDYAKMKIVGCENTSPIFLSPLPSSNGKQFEVVFRAPLSVAFGGRPTIVICAPTSKHRGKFVWRITTEDNLPSPDRILASHVRGSPTHPIRETILLVLPGETLEIETSRKFTRWFWDGREWTTPPDNTSNTSR